MLRHALDISIDLYIHISFHYAGSFGWSDNTALGFLYWNSGQPTGLGAHGQIEECVEFDRTTGKWNDISCFTNRGYVCKTSKGLEIIIPFIPTSRVFIFIIIVC